MDLAAYTIDRLTSSLRLLAVADPRAADTALFMTWRMRHDAVWTPVGTHHLDDFFHGIVTTRDGKPKPPP